MMQPGTGLVPPVTHQQQYQQQPQPPPQWMMMPPQQQQHGFHPQHPQQFWTQQPPPQAAVPPSQPQAMQMQQQFSAEQMGGSNEIKSLWIGDLQYWMDENYLYTCFAQSGELSSVKVIRNKQNGQPEGYGFLEFISRAAAERALQTYNGSLMPNSEQNFRLNWATLGAGERRSDDGPDYTIFVGDLAADVTDYLLLETFKPHYSSIKGAKVVTDRMTGHTKGYGFVRFADESEQLRALSEMNGVPCSRRPMRVGPAAIKKPDSGGQPHQKAAITYQNSPTNPADNDPTNTTIFVGGVDESVSEDHLRQVFGQFGELVHVRIPTGKRCGFVQFTHRACAEQALSVLNGTQLGGRNVRLSWGRSPNKQVQTDQTQWNGSYYGYGGAQGYDAYGYGQPPQDPSAYYGASYPAAGYGNNYQQQQQQQQQQQ